MKKKIDPRNKGLNTRVTFLVTEETKAQLDSLKDSSGVPMAEMLRRLIAEAFNKEKKK
jgi:Ribbon-helix-helix protein, copG family